MFRHPDPEVLVVGTGPVEAGLSEGLIGAGRKLTKVALASKHPYLLVIRQSLLERAAEEALCRKKPLRRSVIVAKSAPVRCPGV